ncbi:MAG: 1,2-phenylacetyl-CoA epoxidase subunit PaaC [Longimicrobiales bacterium]
MDAEFTPGVRDALRDLILVLADSKRLLGMRYAGWILGAPELEAGIACASMAQDEWGHGRLLYALLKDFGEDVDRIEHGREPDEYRSMHALDSAPETWAAFVALNTLADTALTVQFEALRASSYLPIRHRVEKLLEEERFHEAHAAAWFRRLAGGGIAARETIHDAVRSVVPSILQWFGPDGKRARDLVSASVVDATGSTLRASFIERLAPLLREIDAADAFSTIEPDFAGFDETRRRTATGTPDAATIAQVRGDRNRAFLMD